MDKEIPAAEHPVKELSQVNKLMEALAKAQSEFEKLDKDKEANAGTFSYKYASLDACFTATRTALTKNCLAVTQLLSNDGTALFLETILGHSSGQCLKSKVRIASDDSGRKNPIQAMGSAITYLRRYTYCAMVGLVADEDTDAVDAPLNDSQLPDKQYPKNNQNNSYNPNSRKPSEKQLKRLFAIASNSKWEPADVKDFIEFKFQKESSKDLSIIEYNLLCDTIEKSEPPKKETGFANDADIEFDPADLETKQGEENIGGSA